MCIYYDRCRVDRSRVEVDFRRPTLYDASRIMLLPLSDGGILTSMTMRGQRSKLASAGSAAVFQHHVRWYGTDVSFLCHTFSNFCPSDVP